MKAFNLIFGCLVAVTVSETCEALEAENNVNIIEKDKSSWTCYERSINYSAKNPDWGIVLISNNKYFYGQGHFLNYKYENETLYLYDDKDQSTTLVVGLDQENTNNAYTNTYYHFYINENVKRVYKYMTDNREMIL